jgi:hypothetical protein
MLAVGQTDVSTKITRIPGNGLRSEARSLVRNITIAGMVHLDAIDVRVTAEAKGYATAQATTAKTSVVREFSGLTVGSQRICNQCDPVQVVDAINKTLGALGYARATGPEPDVTLGTVRGTLAVVQKNLALQDGDGTVNRDFSTEWPGLEMVLYRDTKDRGLGRWTVQLGGVFAQSQFGVTDALPSDEVASEEVASEEVASDEVASDETVPDDSGSPPPSATTGGQPPAGGDGPISGSVSGAESAPSAGTTPAESVDSAQPIAYAVPAPPPLTPLQGLVRKVRQAISRLFKAAVLLAALWALIYAPVYVARRRRLLREVTAT